MTQTKVLWRKLLRISLSVLILLIAQNTDLISQISPGKLARPHAEFEGLTNCAKCHELGEGITSEKCLACHLEIDDLIKQKRGFHHRSVTLEKKSCASCHSDHAGVEFKMIFWENGRDNFDHKRAGFELKDKHAEAKCDDCHKSEFIKQDLKKLQSKIDLNKTHLGLEQNCISCHEDEHRGQLGNDCSKCHNEKSWKPAEKFDHNKAKFVLTGKHNKVDCAKCHPVVLDTKARPKLKMTFTKFVNLKFNSCIDCHEDVHKGKFGADCEKCHVTSGWKVMKQETFDHSKTRFPLLGKHQTVKCEQCHKSGNMLLPLKFASCQNCHEDVHKGKFGSNCVQCHSEVSWKQIKQQNFDHSKTNFPLKGLHAKVDCKKCHKTGNTTIPLKHDLCQDCHEDIHRSQFSRRTDGGRCESCHDENGFIPALFSIDMHQQGRFKLEGAHIATACVSCHKLAKLKDGTTVRQFLFSQRNCQACHDDTHFGQFTKSNPQKSCEACHATEAWADLKFNHDRDSRFSLEGAHQKVDCNECHKMTRVGDNTFRKYKPIDPTCETCHAGDNVKLLKKKR